MHKHIKKINLTDMKSANIFNFKPVVRACGITIEQREIPAVDLVKDIEGSLVSCTKRPTSALLLKKKKKIYHIPRSATIQFQFSWRSTAYINVDFNH